LIIDKKIRFKQKNRFITGESGFTLFELLVAVLLLAMISVMIYSVLNVGIKFAEKGEKKILHMERRLSLVDLLHRQVKSAWYDNKRRKVIVSSDNDVFRLVTRCPLFYSAAGIVLAVYRFDPADGTLYYLEKRDYYNSDYDDEYVPDYDDMQQLLTDVASFALEYDEENGSVNLEFDEREYEFLPWCRKEEQQK
jgi:prepilin-type N-terminal cleavage/methylation domain-containing protein